MHLGDLRPWGGLAGAALEEADVVLAGIPYEGSAVYRKGAAAAPARLREISKAIPPVTEEGRLILTRVHDLGDLDLGPAVETGWPAVADRLAAVPPGAVLTVMGGDHCTAVPILAAQARRHPDLAVVWLDAHPDLNDYSRHGSWTCGCALRRALETAGLRPDSVAMAGLRDFDMEELEYAAAEGVRLITTAKATRDPAAAGRELARAFAGRPVHVSLDIDVLDPGFAPGTEIPAAGGMSTREVLNLLAALAEESRLVGLDVAEVSPPLDHADITTFAALKFIFEFWGWAGRTSGGDS